MNLLQDKHVLVTGVVNDDSIAYAVALRTLQMGGKVILTSFDRDWERTTEAAESLPGDIDLLELDVTDQTHLERISDELADRWGHVDGIVHAVAFAPRTALAGNFLDTDSAAAQAAFAGSSYSYASLARLLGHFAPITGGSTVGLDFDAQGAWPVYNWMLPALRPRPWGHRRDPPRRRRVPRMAGPLDPDRFEHTDHVTSNGGASSPTGATR